MSARLLLVLLALLAFARPAGAQGVVFASSDPIVSITSNFSGATITFFGNIEPSIEGTIAAGPFDVVLVVRGPLVDRVVRRKSRQFGIMLNADYALYERLPSFYRVLSSRPIDTIIDPAVIGERIVTMEDQVDRTLTASTGNVQLFNTEAIRLMETADLFRTDGRAISFLSPTFFATRVGLPANVPNGRFLAQVFVVRNGEIVAERSQSFFVEKTGFERFLGDAARNQPLLYGIACVLLALLTGWLGGVLFRR
ncbi:TIGR02186 family protein [Pelagibacterium xiamenense]|uniref:TIGR02186 family protein n=1 Tax=Pelagibacterium xiamenense TaxID=2901140 RepID=UPI001E6482DA|nr:TIGR02186 family protein [Pelagibacterium xiamenense]MCD7059079.1 TIGR02186 family protein [Pelagibacterium xiamenense]